jgi:hypothetical protein
MRTKRNRSIKKINEVVEDLLVDFAADKTADVAVDNIVGEDKVEEDDETSLNTQTPTGNNGTVPATTNQTTETDNEDESDPMIEYILQQIQQNKDKQIQDAQFDYAYRQQQAEKIVNDIEEYIKQNKK